MSNKKLLDYSISIVGWAFLLIWWGLRWSVFTFLPDGSGLLGTSLVLFTVSLVRRSLGQPIYAATTFFAILTLVAGASLFLFAVIGPAYQPPVFATLLTSLGLVLLGYGVSFYHRSTMGGS